MKMAKASRVGEVMALLVTVANMAKKRQDLGVTAVQVAKNVRRLRQRQGMSLAELVEATGDRLSLDAIKKIEAASNPSATVTRRVDADELIVLALALGVNPNALLLPPSSKPSEPVEMTGAHRQLRAEEAWGWARGEEPLVTPGQEYKPGTFRETVNPPWVHAQMDRDLAVKDHFFGAQWVTEEQQREDSPPDGTDT